MKSNRLTRLFFAVALLALTTALRAQSPAASETPPSSPSLSPVILAENSDVVQRFAVNPDMVRDMVNNAVLKLTSAQEIGMAWKRLGVTPQDVVGIKITTMGGPLLSTHRAIVQTICDGLQAAGLSPSHIIIWDKYERDMRQAGYDPALGDSLHAGIAAVFPGTGYDPNVVYKNEQIGTLIWGDFDFIRNETGADLLEDARNSTDSDKPYGGKGSLGDTLLGKSSTLPQSSDRSYYARLLTRICTKIINVPVLTDNPDIGINGCLGSLALACVDNNRRFQGDPTYGDPAICEILDKDFMRHKVIIHILDALVAEYAGGPEADPQFTESIGALYVSRDPVAIDSLVLPRIEEWRKEAHLDPIGKMASHIKSAAGYNLGTDDPQRIQLVRLSP